MRVLLFVAACHRSVPTELNADTFQEIFLDAFCGHLRQCCELAEESYCRYNHDIERQRDFHLERAESCLEKVRAGLADCTLAAMPGDCLSVYTDYASIWESCEEHACGEGYCDFETMRCTEWVTQGGVCRMTYECAAPLSCQQGEDLIFTCEPRLGYGEACLDDHCELDLYCREKLCVLRQDDGARCEWPHECKSTCRDGVCGPLSPPTNDFCGDY